MLNFFKNNFGKTMLIYLSWWFILFGTSAIVKLLIGPKYYMLFFYGGVILVTYIIYLVIPFIKWNRLRFNHYIKSIKLQMTFQSWVVSILLLLILFLGIGVHSKLGQTELILASFGGFNWFIYMQPPLVEELLFRGLIPSFFNKTSTKFLVSNTLFATLHIKQGFQGIIISFILGALLYFLVKYTQSLIPSMLAHYIINANLSLALLSVLFLTMILIMFSIVKTKKETNHYERL
ncbi:CPBP family intramembrane glutamic endopeptidase [Vagococcus carniphilus]|uniref:CPBP family intramembrane glutamic endopeptidase n=1 Tax=Vagococcus carniphilus TaxID=218144 RepID=UPI003BA96987